MLTFGTTLVPLAILPCMYVLKALYTTNPPFGEHILAVFAVNMLLRYCAHAGNNATCLLNLLGEAHMPLKYHTVQRMTSGSLRLCTCAFLYTLISFVKVA